LIDVGGQIIAPKEGKKYNGDQYKSEIKNFMERNEWLKKIAWQMVI
jgi:hypothetical protein